MASKRLNKLLTGAAVWGGVTAVVFLARAVKRRANMMREKRVAAAGGRMPTARNIVAALKQRADDPKRGKSVQT